MVTSTTPGLGLPKEEEAKMAEISQQEAEAELMKVRGDWLKRPGVTAVDIGLRFEHGQMTNQIAVRVHVRRKRAPESLPPEEIFPERLGRVPVDVIEASYGLE